MYMFVCLTLLASFFLPSHLSFKNMYNVHMYISFSNYNINVHVHTTWILCYSNTYHYLSYQFIHEVAKFLTA